MQNNRNLYILNENRIIAIFGVASIIIFHCKMMGEEGKLSHKANGPFSNSTKTSNTVSFEADKHVIESFI